MFKKKSKKFWSGSCQAWKTSTVPAYVKNSTVHAIWSTYLMITLINITLLLALKQTHCDSQVFSACWIIPFLNRTVILFPCVTDITSTANPE